MISSELTGAVKTIYWFNLSVAAILVALSSVILNLQLLGFSSTAYLLVLSVASIFMGTALLLGKTQVTQPHDPATSSQIAPTARADFLLLLAALFAVSFLAHQWVGTVGTFYGLTGLQRVPLSPSSYRCAFLFSYGQSRGVGPAILVWAGVIGA